MGNSDSWLNDRFGKRLKQIREEESKTQESFAKRVGLSLRYYQEIEAGEKFPSASTLEMFHEKTGRKVKEFFDFSQLQAD